MQETKMRNVENTICMFSTFSFFLSFLIIFFYKKWEEHFHVLLIIFNKNMFYPFGLLKAENCLWQMIQNNFFF